MADNDPEHITAREFQNAVTSITKAMAEGFEGVHNRVGEVKDELRAMNSKVASQQSDITYLKVTSASQGVLLAEHKRKLDKTDSVAGFRHVRKDDPPPDNEPITVKDVKRAVYLLGIFISIATGVVKGLPLLLKAIAP